ncbi:MAG: ROK family transcriptional regulator [Deltaproteobacteria bacterium]|nr:ROK family transcriptional regulator [Deltaproteobacteria bacterium]MBT4644695.1 ROK family transcriptional regulator [Deltaproteobacteria bacterium]MBT6503320.1 ROK family transcriptional regulator [Deltaproteobacteria bacterium]MBT6613736.1 ROK family transcriptional regulator [Deltaproteobacteria bacterium]MBT7153924.1 ROK family transcriptional regulator [Deltaproteobacteria bacterium]
MQVANRDLIRAINRFNILNTIRVAKLISRVDIAKSTGLSQASVTGISAELIRDGIILEKKSRKSSLGRRPILLSLNPDGAIVIGVKISIHQVSIVLLDFEATVLKTDIVPLDRKMYTVEEIAEVIVQAVQACLWKANYHKSQISGIGIGIPGIVDSPSGLVKFLPNYQWRNANLQELVHRRLELLTYVENDANALAVAEQWFGEGRGVDNFLLISLEYGVGSGIVINGQLYRGQSGISSEFGHTTIDGTGPECRCGKRGCIESVAGENALLREAGILEKKGDWIRTETDEISLEEIIQAAREGHQGLKDIFERAGRTLGIGIANLVGIFGPAKIFITGKCVMAGDLMFDPLFETVDLNISKNFDIKANIIVQKWTQLDWARGAGAVVLQEMYKSPVHRIVPII